MPRATPRAGKVEMQHAARCFGLHQFLKVHKLFPLTLDSSFMPRERVPLKKTLHCRVASHLLGSACKRQVKTGKLDSQMDQSGGETSMQT